MSCRGDLHISSCDLDYFFFFMSGASRLQICCVGDDKHICCVLATNTWSCCVQHILVLRPENQPAGLIFVFSTPICVPFVPVRHKCATYWSVSSPICPTFVPVRHKCVPYWCRTRFTPPPAENIRVRATNIPRASRSKQREYSGVRPHSSRCFPRVSHGNTRASRSFFPCETRWFVRVFPSQTHENIRASRSVFSCVCSRRTRNCSRFALHLSCSSFPRSQICVPRGVRPSPPSSHRSVRSFSRPIFFSFLEKLGLEKSSGLDLGAKLWSWISIFKNLFLNFKFEVLKFEF